MAHTTQYDNLKSSPKKQNFELRYSQHPPHKLETTGEESYLNLQSVQTRAHCLHAARVANSTAIEMSLCARSLQIGLVPGAALGGLLAGVAVTTLARRISAQQTRRGLFVRRRARRPCARCAGFGISRCTLCSGEGICVRDEVHSFSSHVS